MFVWDTKPKTLKIFLTIIFYITSYWNKFFFASFFKIAAHVGRVLMNLAADSGQWSRQLLQNVVDILTTMVDGLVDSFKGEAQDMFKDKYADVVSY